MKSLKSSLPAAVILLFSALPAFVNAQGIIIPGPCEIRRRCPRPVPPERLPTALPVKSIKIDTRITGQVATTRVEQVFRNDLPFVIQGQYFFPLPEDASVEGFSIWENGRRLSGEVRSREEARRIYNQIIRKMLDPGLLEYAGRDLFRASVFPIPAGSDKKIELVYSQILKSDSGTVSYKYPLGTGRVLWAGRAVIRRERGRPITPPGPRKIGTVSGTIEIVTPNKVRNVYSPSHPIDVSERKGNSVKVTFESKGKPDDFRLFYGTARRDFNVSLITYREPGKDGYFLLLVSPDNKVSETAVVNKDIVFVLDTSGSMQDSGKLVKARPALKFGVRALNSGDRFNVINFSGEEHLLLEGLVNADETNKKMAESFLSGLRANGGTNINGALMKALEQFGETGRPKMLVLLTDGLPTVGEQNIEKIIANVKSRNVPGLRLFPFGVGYDVNTRLLDRLGRENAGVADYVRPDEDLEVKVSSFFNKVNSPVLSDVGIRFGRVQRELVYPRSISDVFRGAQIVLIGRYTNKADLKDVAIELDGITGGKRRSFTYDKLDFPIRSTENDFLPRLWASRRVGWLIEQIRSNGESKELKDEIISLGTRYGIVTPYTSYLATDGTFRTRATRSNRFEVDRAADAAISVELGKEKGRGAVLRSVQQNALQSAATTNTAGKSQVFLVDSEKNQFVGGRNFINDSGAWVDTEYDPASGLPTVQIRFGSDRYFSLALSEKGINRYLSMGRNVTFVWKGKVYMIKD